MINVCVTSEIHTTPAYSDCQSYYRLLLQSMSSSFSITSGIMLYCHSSGKGQTGELLAARAVPWKRPRIRAPERLERSDCREATEWEWEDAIEISAGSSKAGGVVISTGICTFRYSATLAREEGK